MYVLRTTYLQQKMKIQIYEQKIVIIFYLFYSKMITLLFLPLVKDQIQS